MLLAQIIQLLDDSVLLCIQHFLHLSSFLDLGFELGQVSAQICFEFVFGAKHEHATHGSEHSVFVSAFVDFSYHKIGLFLLVLAQLQGLLAGTHLLEGDFKLASEFLDLLLGFSHFQI